MTRTWYVTSFLQFHFCIFSQKSVLFMYKYTNQHMFGYLREWMLRFSWKFPSCIHLISQILSYINIWNCTIILVAYSYMSYLNDLLLWKLHSMEGLINSWGVQYILLTSDFQLFLINDSKINWELWCNIYILQNLRGYYITLENNPSWNMYCKSGIFLRQLFSQFADF